MLHQLLTLTLGPLLLLQGRRVRKTIPLLPEPPGERCGVQGRGPLLRLLLLGDSAAAGVGAGHQDAALVGNLVRELSESFGVDWVLQAQTGATTRSTSQSLR